MAELHDLPSTYYRVSLKALVFDGEERLLVLQDQQGEWEIPGGGWEHQESPEECLKRELLEETGGLIAHIEGPKFMYVDHKPPGYYKLSIVFRVALRSAIIALQDDDLADYRFVGRDALLVLPFQQSEKSILAHIDKIWPELA